MELETERLYLREMEQKDLGDLAQMLKDKEVMAAYGHDFTDAHVQAWLNRQRKRYEIPWMGLHAAVLKETNEVVGQAGLTLQPCEGQNILEIGYLLKKEFWHSGYATEAALYLKQYAFEIQRVPKVSCIIKADNFASIRVAERLGMKKEKEFVTRYFAGDMLHYVYTVYRENETG